MNAEQMRQEFEVWATKAECQLPIERHADATQAYKNCSTACAWTAWQAAVGQCPDCNGSGMRDSGGVQPWGESITVPCDCRMAPNKTVEPSEKDWADFGAWQTERDAIKALQPKCPECNGHGGWVTESWIDPVSGPECEGERCDVCGGSGFCAQPQAPQGAVTELTPAQIDKAYRDVWSTVPHAHRLTAFAHAIYSLKGAAPETPEGKK